VKDEKVSVGCAVAYGSWAVAAGFLIATVGAEELWLFACMMFSLGVAVTATVRTYFVEFTTMVRRAFEMDHDSVTPLPPRRW